MARARDIEITEYRINKKGSECFRTWYRSEAEMKLAKLRERKPNGVYTMQYRTYQNNGHGAMALDCSGRPVCTPWFNL